MDVRLMKKLKLSLDIGRVVDGEVQNKINEIYEIDRLADIKLANNDFRITNRHKELANQGYFKRKYTQEDVDKSKRENEKFELQQNNKVDIENKRNAIISDFEFYQRRIDEIRNNLNTSNIEVTQRRINDLIMEIQNYINNISIDNDQVLYNYIVCFNNRNFE